MSPQEPLSWAMAQRVGLGPQRLEAVTILLLLGLFQSRMGEYVRGGGERGARGGVVHRGRG